MWRAAATVLVCALGGLVVGLLVRVFGETTGIFAEMMAEFGRTGRFDYRATPGVVLTSFASLSAGGSLGPEMPMADACGGLGTLLADKMKLDDRETRSLGFSGIGGMLAAFITSPFAGALLGLESARAGLDHVWMLFPGLIASASATVAYVLLSGSFFGHLYVFPDYDLSLLDLVLAAPLGLVGALAGGLFIYFFRLIGRAMEPLEQWPVLRGMAGGAGLGLAGALFPLVLFSGEHQTSELIAKAPEIGAASLVLLAVVKTAVTPLCLRAGWKGGYIFPAMFAGAALGLAVNVAIPAVPQAVAVAATIAGAMVAVMKAPIFTALFVMVLVEPSTAPVVAVAVVVSSLATARLTIVPARAEH
jgi:H+/Cl- antiporter ClcA